jgi:uncharacterized protein (DUF488 family)
MPRIFTIGHSTRTLEELVALLREHQVERVADIRRHPGSRRLPQFSAGNLARSLPDAGLAWEHFESLGGRRKPVPDSQNLALRNEQFRGYADHMATTEFAHAVDRLLDDTRITAIMCAEAVPWRCHRNLVSDELLRRRVEVIHILGPGSTRPHTAPPYARFEKDRVIYPPLQGTLQSGGL